MIKTEEISFIVEVQLRPGARPAFEALLPELLKAASAEPGLRAYECYLGQGDTVCFFERYADSAAALEHMRLFGQGLSPRYMELITPQRVLFLGDPNPELKEQLAPLFSGSESGPTAAAYSPMGGYSSGGGE